MVGLEVATSVIALVLPLANSLVIDPKVSAPRQEPGKYSEKSLNPDTSLGDSIPVSASMAFLTWLSTTQIRVCFYLLHQVAAAWEFVYCASQPVKSPANAPNSLGAPWQQFPGDPTIRCLMAPLQDDGSNQGEGRKPSSLLSGRGLSRQKPLRNSSIPALIQGRQRLTAGGKDQSEETVEELWQDLLFQKPMLEN